MGIELRTTATWYAWNEVLLGAFESRFSALREAGYQMSGTRTSFVAMFLQKKAICTISSDPLSEAMNLMRIGPASDSHYDNLAFKGHGVGMVERTDDLRQYLQSLRSSLEPDGRILLTSIAVQLLSKQKLPGLQTDQSEHLQKLSTKQFQNEFLIGPFFSMLSIKIETLRTQAMLAGWRCEVVYRQDNLNYSMLLSKLESEK